MFRSIAATLTKSMANFWKSQLASEASLGFRPKPRLSIMPMSAALGICPEADDWPVTAFNNACVAAFC